jgi:tripartite-type tricarboxylate transporter receptor subunit TctC
LIGSAVCTRAQDYPSKPIRIIVPAAPGGSTDIGARLLAQHMGETLGQTFVVENVGGGGGRIGPLNAARAPADGYTLLFGNSIGQALIPGIVKSPPYDPIKDFTPIGGIFWYSTLIVCNPSMPFDDLSGMIAFAKANPGKLAIATAGLGSGNHFSSELLASMANIRVTHIPYRGNAPAVQDVIGGFANCIHMGEAKPHIDAGRLKALATTGLRRDPRFPSIPTVDESGLKGYDITWWQGLFAPAGLPPAIVEKLIGAARKVAEDPKVKATMFEPGFFPEFVPPADLVARIQADMRKFRKIADDAHIEIK